MQVEASPCATADFPRPARRPAMSSLENRRLKATSQNRMRHWRTALADLTKGGHAISSATRTHAPPESRLRTSPSDPVLQADSKSERVANYHRARVRAALEIVGAYFCERSSAFLFS